MRFSTKFIQNIFVKLLYGITATSSLIVIIVITACFFSRISPPEKIVPLEGEWKISFNDSQTFSNPDFDDSDWDKVTLPGKFIHHSINKTGKVKGICWLRKSFETVSYNGKTGIILGRIANADETYVNGIKVGNTGSFPPETFSRWNYTRRYLLPDMLLTSEVKNVVAVRVSYNQTGEIQGYMAVASGEDCEKYEKAFNFFQITLGYIAIGVGISLFIIFNIFYYKKPDVEEYFYYCLQLAAGLPVILETCIGLNIYPDHVFRSKLIMLSWIVLNVAHPIFLHRIYGLKRKILEKVLWAYCAIFFILCIFDINENAIRFYGTIFIITTCLIGFYNISCHISALILKRPDARIFSFFGIVVIICSLHDGYLYLMKYFAFDVGFMNAPYSVMLFHIGALFLYAGTSLVLVSRFINIATEMDGLNSTLENYIIDNSFLNKQLEQALNQKQTSEMSSKTEEKIKEVIRIIDKNYLDELDRMILAKSVGVHPDNLGKQFKKFTGIKLGDYIYNLRINQAAKRLRETDEKIIDIAFSVGFESLRTFNRVFPKFMKTTPIKYRKRQRDSDKSL